MTVILIISKWKYLKLFYGYSECSSLPLFAYLYQKNSYWIYLWQGKQSKTPYMCERDKYTNKVFLFFFFFFFIHMCIQCLGHFLPLPRPPPSFQFFLAREGAHYDSTHTPSLRTETQPHQSWEMQFLQLRRGCWLGGRSASNKAFSVVSGVIAQKSWKLFCPDWSKSLRTQQSSKIFTSLPLPSLRTLGKRV
jgi:hypothetical protein